MDENNQQLSREEEKQAEKERADQNNANNVKNAADVAIASKNPYAMAAGAAVKAADKITGGKASQAIGKSITKANKMTPGGKQIQKGLNKLNESGASDAIGTAARAKNGGGKKAGGSKPKAPNQNKKSPSVGSSQGNKSSSSNNTSGVNYTENNKKPKLIIAAILPAIMITMSSIFIILLPLLVIVAIGGVIASIFTGNSNSNTDYYSFLHYENGCNLVKVNSELMPLDEYVAGVISREVPGFPEETLKAFAISARTYTISRFSKISDEDSSCYYDVTDTTDSAQVFSKTTDERYLNAAKDTSGIVITISGNIATGNYDASCVYTPNQARQLNATSVSDDYYYIKYGYMTIGGVNLQPIPKSFNCNGICSLDTYIAYAKAGEPCKNNHGGGMSQNGSYYLETEEGYDYKQIISYYYQGQEQLATIKSKVEYVGDYPLDPDDPLYANTKLLHDKSLGTLLTENGTDITEFNVKLKSSIEEAGAGTRNGVIAAAVNLIGYLAEMDVKINYQWGGKYNSFGLSGYFGTEDHSTNCGNERIDTDICEYNYQWVGFDCSGFVNWAIKNGMNDLSIKTQKTMTNGGTADIVLDPDEAVCKPGGTLVSNGHIVLVVGVDEITKKYIVAEAAGSRIDSNTGGIKLSYYDFNKKGYYCNNLDDIYGD